MSWHRPYNELGHNAGGRRAPGQRNLPVDNSGAGRSRCRAEFSNRLNVHAGSSRFSVHFVTSSDGKRRRIRDRFRSASPAILPSLLQCDFLDLRSEVDAVTAAGCEILHLDVMDGHFVPNLTYGMPICRGLSGYGDVPLDVHLMISDPIAYVPQFADAGADSITFHVEAVDDAGEVIDAIRRHDLVAGIAINPDTPMSEMMRWIDRVDLALVMSVQAGFGGQKFNPVAVERIAQLRSHRDDLLIEVDGGIDATTAPQCHAAGCDLFVVGSAIFGRDNYSVAVSEITQAMETAK